MHVLVENFKDPISVFKDPISFFSQSVTDLAAHLPVAAPSRSDSELTVHQQALEGR